MLPTHVTQIQKSADLVTSIEATRAGFISQAKEKILRAKPYVDEAIKFKDALLNATHLTSALAMHEFRPQLIAAAGFSAKSLNNIPEAVVEVILRSAIEEIMNEAGDRWREAILSRYLLTKGDSLGGSMRNVTGSLAQQRFSTLVLGALPRNRNTKITKNVGNQKIQKIQWNNRTLLFDKKSPLIRTNIDVILLDSSAERNERILLNERERYLSCGELKGGIDPAGADEHWKTARSALERIRVGLEPHSPTLFFVGAAIEQNMAAEIFKNLEEGHLQHAANLNYQNQLDDLVGWLVSL